MLTLSGHLTQPPSFSDFDYAAYLARQGVFSYMSFPKVANLGRNEEVGIAAYIVGQRASARRVLQATVPEPEASIAVGVVTGDRSSISDQVQTAFRRSGTTTW
jgi:competence protein ComEC